MNAVFLTGCTGFIGRHVLSTLSEASVSDVRCLVRREGAARRLPGFLPQWREIAGDLLRPTEYASEIPSGGTVIHVAGIAGKRRPAVFHAQNVDATRALVSASEKAGVDHLVHVSSIAARAPDLTEYPYGASKRDAEHVVRASSLPHVILRPTMVFGPESPNQAALERLALLPRPVLFGTGEVRVQPVHVRDLARVIVHAALHRQTGDVLEVGGPEALTLDALFALIREAHGVPPRTPIHLPVGPVRQVLRLLEPALLPVLPFTAGQLAVFLHSSCAEERGAASSGHVPRASIRQMLLSENRDAA